MRIAFFNHSKVWCEHLFVCRSIESSKKCFKKLLAARSAKIWQPRWFGEAYFLEKTPGDYLYCVFTLSLSRYLASKAINMFTGWKRRINLRLKDPQLWLQI